jgi:transcriptional regulator with XRE-family HTH domain
VDPAALARRRGRLGKVPRDGCSELGKYFGIVVREEMKWQDYNQRELAKVAGVSESEMSLLLNAKHSVLMHTAECVADALGFELEVLITRARALMEAAQGEAAGLRDAQIGAVRAAVSAALKSSKL